MTSFEIAESAFKPLRPDQCAAATDIAYKTIVNAELTARLEKTRRLQRARLAVSSAVSATVR